jgi:hypothetical protein
MGHKIRVVIKYKVYLFNTNILTVSIYEAQNMLNMTLLRKIRIYFLT